MLKIKQVELFKQWRPIIPENYMDLPLKSWKETGNQSLQSGTEKTPARRPARRPRQSHPWKEKMSTAC